MLAAPAPELPGPWQSHGLAPHGRRMMGRCFPPHACAAGRAVPICGEGTRCGAGRRESSPSSPPRHGFDVLQLQSSTSASAETFLRSSFCPRFNSGDAGTGTAPALGRGSRGWLAGRMHRMHGEEHGCLQPCTWWVQPGRTVDERVYWVADPREVHQSLGQTCVPNGGPWRTI